MRKPILIVQGGQYGSEAKGAIAGLLCRERSIDFAVRTGATNAGHTVYYEGVPFKMQQLPVGWVNPDTALIIGAGALIDPLILERECDEVSKATGRDIRKQLKIDRRAGLHLLHHMNKSKASGRHHAIGATGKGCSEALIERISGRGQGYVLFGDTELSHQYDVCDTEAFLNYAHNEGASIMLEGTQGQLLDLYLGPYPYTTHKQTGPAQWMLESGLSPALPTEICMVVRTLPIRVAGNSGPMPNETSWPDVARSINTGREAAGLPALVHESAIAAFEEAIRQQVATEFPVPDGRDGLDMHDWTPVERLEYQETVSELHKAALNSLPATVFGELTVLFEMTTVTKKLRRIAHIDRQTLVDSARQIRPSWIALTFMNYLFPECWFNVPEGPAGNRQSAQDQLNYIRWIEEACEAPVRMVSYGPEDRHVLKA